MGRDHPRAGPRRSLAQARPRSRTVALTPSRARHQAIDRPITPPPTTTTSVSSASSPIPGLLWLPWAWRLSRPSRRSGRSTGPRWRGSGRAHPSRSPRRLRASNGTVATSDQPPDSGSIDPRGLVCDDGQKLAVGREVRAGGRLDAAGEPGRDSLGRSRAEQGGGRVEPDLAKTSASRPSVRFETTKASPVRVDEQPLGVEPGAVGEPSRSSRRSASTALVVDGRGRVGLVDLVDRPGSAATCRYCRCRRCRGGPSRRWRCLPSRRSAPRPVYDRTSEPSRPDREQGSGGCPSRCGPRRSRDAGGWLDDARRLDDRRVAQPPHPLQRARQRRRGDRQPHQSPGDQSTHGRPFSTSTCQKAS